MLSRPTIKRWSNRRSPPEAQLEHWTQGMKDSGSERAVRRGSWRTTGTPSYDDYIESLDESLHPLSAYAQAVKTANEAVDQRKKALGIIGATEGQLAQVEAMRAEVVRQATEEMLRSFDQSVAQRWAAVNGNSDEVGRAISQANELQETIQQFRKGSAQVAGTVEASRGGDGEGRAGCREVRIRFAQGADGCAGTAAGSASATGDTGTD